MNVEIEEALDFGAMYEQLSGLRHVQSRIAPLIPIFSGYHRIVERLAITMEHHLASDHVSADESHIFTSSLNDITSKVQSFEVNARFLLEKVANAIQMVRKVDLTQNFEYTLITDEKASDTISLKSQNNTEDMSNNMLKDSLAMRIITWVTLVFLPGTFVSVSLGKSQVTIRTSKSLPILEILTCRKGFLWHGLLHD